VMQVQLVEIITHFHWAEALCNIGHEAIGPFRPSMSSLIGRPSFFVVLAHSVRRSPSGGSACSSEIS
jgi:hypothetical protein